MILLNDGWAIDADERCYILGKPTQSTVKGKPVTQMQSATYHGTLAQAFTAHLQRLQRGIVRSTDMSAAEAYKAFLQAHSEVVHLFGEAIQEGK